MFCYVYDAWNSGSNRKGGVVAPESVTKWRAQKKPVTQCVLQA